MSRFLGTEGCGLAVQPPPGRCLPCGCCSSDLRPRGVRPSNPRRWKHMHPAMGEPWLRVGQMGAGCSLRQQDAPACWLLVPRLPAVPPAHLTSPRSRPCLAARSSPSPSTLASRASSRLRACACALRMRARLRSGRASCQPSSAGWSGKAAAVSGRAGRGGKGRMGWKVSPFKGSMAWRGMRS